MTERVGFMEYTLRTNDGKLVKINPIEDVQLYDSPRNPPDTGTTSDLIIYMESAKFQKSFFTF